MSFAEALHQWQGFFTLLGEAAASFAGLLFVTLALNRAEFRDPEKRHLLLLARQTFFNLMMLTALSLLALAPGLGTDSQSYGGALGIACLGGLATCFLAIREERRARTGRGPTRDYVRAYYMPAAIYALMLTPAIEIIGRGRNELVFVGAGLLGLLLASARNAWTLLFLP